ncbi:MAG: hypothetical protein KME05_19115 [Gloeocapsa sp. UFS-A4-WI-NPMV-4B04]|nr:hypothetical protein [Gloeocapsa sp. UFS-A4-WI-NPMV-4B04]
MRIWLTCFGMLFAIAELYQWAKDLSLPLPIYILGGAFLAIASNYNKRSGLFFQNSSTELPAAINSANSTSWDNLSPSQQTAKPISFTIKSSSEQNRLDETKLS